ncbi:MAG: Rid family hydrolase [Bilophila wadsworthia]
MRPACASVNYSPLCQGRFHLLPVRSGPLSPRCREVVGTAHEEQAAQTLANMKAVLEAAGLAVTDIAKTTVFVTNMDDFAAFNEVHAAFMGEHRPARLCGSQQHCPRLSANGCHLL